MKKETKVFWGLMIFCGSLVLGIKYIFPLMAPFILGGVFASLIEPMVRALERKLRLRRDFAIILVLICLVITLFLFFGLTVLVIYQEAQKLLPEISSLVERVSLIANIAIQKFQDNLPYPLTEYSKNFLFVPESIGGVARSVINGIVAFLPRLPHLLIAIFLGSITAFFFSRDKELIVQFIYRFFPRRWYSLINRLKNEAISSMTKFIRAEFILVLITVVFTTLLFRMLGVSGAIAYGFLTGIFDIVPVLGSGMIFFPAIVVNLIFCNYQQAIILLVGYFLLMLIRQLAEIKIMGEDFNFHPLLMLLVLYLGAQLFGIGGVFFGPILMILLRGFYRAVY